MARVLLLLLGLSVVLQALHVAAVIRPRLFEGRLNEGLVRRGLKPAGEFDDEGELWFEDQFQDHFDLLNRNTWKQRYFVNDASYTPHTGAPVFLMIGGEGPLSAGAVGDHFVLGQYAPEFKALVVAVEHRFYGKSMPTGGSSTQELRFLSSRQALADLARFRDFIAGKYGAEDSKFVLFGGSYSGCLSGWTRAKFPHLFHASLASSGPVHAQLDFPEYFEVDAEVMGPKCSGALKKAGDEVVTMLATSAGRSKLSDMFETCTPVDEDNNNQITFLSALTDPIAGIIQYNLDNVPYQPMNATAMCDMLLSGSDVLSNWATLVKEVNKFEGEQCTAIDYKQFIQEMQATSAARSWVFQTCTEFGFYQSGASTRQPFWSRISCDWYVQQCADIYGIEGLTPEINATNEYYGDRDVVATRIVWPNGSHDPWHVLGITETVHQSEPAILIDGTAHCADLYPPKQEGELPSLAKARDEEWDLLRKWLQED